ncbi:hypothetical protein SAMN05216436_1267 [bacterium A37T11]|nr:hypothetical protein SAMN05216436_1267 [bacterium A37T11]
MEIYGRSLKLQLSKVVLPVVVSYVPHHMAWVSYSNYICRDIPDCLQNKEDKPIKDSLPSYIDFLKKTEWVGTDDGVGSQFPRPVDITFGNDSSLAIYAVYNIRTENSNKNMIKADSLLGKITKIDSIADGSTQITVNFPVMGGDEVITIKDRKKLTLLFADHNSPHLNSFNYTLDLFPATGFSLTDTKWSGALANPDETPVNYRYNYPDLSAVNFHTTSIGKTASIIKNGGVAYENIYKQMGARVYVTGYNEGYSWDMDIASETGNYTDWRQGRTIIYYGVILPTGNNMYVDARSSNARLPNYTQSSEIYGPKGVTPNISKQ